MCSSCKKKFSSLEQAELHAARTLHDDFVEAKIENESEYEIVPSEPVKILTEEQKEARLSELRAKLALKRAAREKEAKEAEVLRKASTKELEQIRRELQAKEIKMRIEEDRENKKRQIEAEKAKLTDVSDNVEKVLIESVPMSQNPTTSTSARIQIKLPAPNPPLKLTFDSPTTQTLKDLKERIKSECPSIKTSSFELMQTFPTRILGKDDDGTSLSELGLAPSASLILK